MKKLIMTVLLVMAMCIGAHAESYIGLFDNLEGTTCYGNTEIYVTKTVHVLAWLDPDIQSVTAVEFSILNLPENGDGGVLSQIWASPLTIGYLGHRFSLAFMTPHEGPLVYLGSLLFYPTSDTWIGREHQLMVREAQDSGTLAVVDQSYATLEVEGGSYRFNCSEYQTCDCRDSVPTEDISWSSIKALY